MDVNFMDFVDNGICENLVLQKKATLLRDIRINIQHMLHICEIKIKKIPRSGKVWQGVSLANCQ